MATINTTTKLNEIEGWDARVKSLNDFITAMGDRTAEEFLRDGAGKSGKAQALSVLLHCSAGYIGDKFRGKTSSDDLLEVLEKVIAPELTPEEIKAQQLDTARSVLESLKAQNVPESVIKLSVGSMPQGKKALEEFGL